LREKIAADVGAVAAEPEVISRLSATGQVPNPGSSAEFAESIEKQRIVAAAAGKALGLTPSVYVPQ